MIPSAARTIISTTATAPDRLRLRTLHVDVLFPASNLIELQRQMHRVNGLGSTVGGLTTGQG